MKLPYPNRAQWCVIWASVLTAAHLWLHLELGAWLPDSRGAWGLPAYLAPALDYRETPKLAVTVLVIGALLIWQLSRPVSLAVSWPAARVWIGRAILASGLVVVGCVLWYVIVSSRKRPEEIDYDALAKKYGAIESEKVPVQKGDIFDRIEHDAKQKPDALDQMLDQLTDEKKKKSRVQRRAR